MSGLAVSQHAAGANMQVDVAAGLALINMTTTLLTPNETINTWLYNDAVVEVTVPTADATNPRIDRIVAKFDVSLDPNGSASNNVAISLVEGTPAGSPAAPAEPSNAITLAVISVPASDTTIGTAQITDSRTYVTLDTTVLADVIRAVNLASTATGKGASLVGVEDSAANFAATNVEAALAELQSNIDTLDVLGEIGFYGDGNDSTPTWTSGASLDPSTEKRYTTATLPVSQTLTVSSVNTPLIIHNTGSVTINGTVDMNGTGGAAGSGTSSGGGSGTAGTAGNTLISGWTSGSGNGGTAGKGGGGGASPLASGSSSSGGDTTGGTAIAAAQLAFLAGLLRGVGCGGGGGGAGNNGTTSGNGGAGGGALVWFVGGNLTLGASSIIRANGASGGNGTGAGAGGGGGGGGGTIVILVAGTITNSGVTLSASAGSGGTGAPAGWADKNF